MRYCMLIKMTNGGAVLLNTEAPMLGVFWEVARVWGTQMGGDRPCVGLLGVDHQPTAVTSIGSIIILEHPMLDALRLFG